MIDITFLLFVLFFFVNGFVKGFLRTILGPITLIITVFAAYYYYSQTQNLLTSFLIGFLGPIFLRILFFLILNIFDLALSKKAENISLLSRLSGGLINTFWGGAYIIAAIYFLAIVPISHPKVKALQENINSSLIFKIIDKQTQNYEPMKAFQIKDVLSGLQDPKVIERVKESGEFKELSDSPAFQNFFDNPEVQTLLDNQDIPGLMKSPELQSLISDKDALKKIMDLNKKIIEEKNSEIEGLLNSESQETNNEGYEE
jgi:hypothetical protein